MLVVSGVGGADVAVHVTGDVVFGVAVGVGVDGVGASRVACVRVALLGLVALKEALMAWLICCVFWDLDAEVAVSRE